MHGQQCFTSRIAAEKYLSVALVSNTLNLDLFATHGGELEKRESERKGKEKKARSLFLFFLYLYSEKNLFERPGHTAQQTQLNIYF